MFHVTIRVNPRMLEHMRLHSGAMRFVIEEASDTDAALRAVDEAGRRVAAIRHPEEGEQYASFISGIELEPTGPSFWVDMADAEADPGVLEEVLETVVSALEDSGLEDALLSFPPKDLPQRIAESVQTGLVPPQLHAPVLARVERGEDPLSMAQWLATESKRLDESAYDEKKPRDDAKHNQWAWAYGLILSLQGLINSSLHKGVPDSEVLAEVITFLQVQGRLRCAAMTSLVFMGLFMFIAFTLAKGHAAKTIQRRTAPPDPRRV